MKTPVIALLLSFICIRAMSQDKKPALEITHLSGNFYVYTTWQVYGTAPYPSNSMYLVTSAGVVLFDTPWDSTQNQPLLDSIYARHQKKVVLCIATHFHSDRTRGLVFCRQRGIPTYTSAFTKEFCKRRGEPEAEYVFEKDTTFRIGNYSFRTFYPGEGHTPDNIVIWFPKDRVLYGGCFVKSTEANDPGNMSDANTTLWPRSIERTIEVFPNPRFVIPGHLSWADNRSLQHTLQLLEQYGKK